MRLIAAAKLRSAGILILLVLLGTLCTAIAFLVLLYLAFPAWHAIRLRQASALCEDRLLRIGQALRTYEQTYHSLPPAFVLGKDGKPAHSWRVLILPQLGREDLYRLYDFEQPWSSSRNSELNARMPEVFACPSDADAASNGETSYAVLVGPRTAFPGNSARRLSDISDPLSDTLLVAESAATGRSWLEPSDIDLRVTNLSVNARGKGGIRGAHPEGARILMADGQVRRLDKSTPPELVNAMTTIDGDEPVR
jgi:hypothetical protein